MPARPDRSPTWGAVGPPRATRDPGLRARRWRGGLGAILLGHVGEALGQRRRAVAAGVGLVEAEFALHLLELGGRHAVGRGLGQPAGAPGAALGRLDVGSARRVRGHVPELGLDPLAAVAVLSLPLLPVRQHRGGDEDRRIGPGRHADEQREREVGQLGRAGRAAEQEQRDDRHQRARGRGDRSRQHL